MRDLVIVCTVGCWIASSASAETKVFEVVIKGGKYDRENTPVVVPLELPKAFANTTQAFLADMGVRMIGQLTSPGLMTEKIKATSPDTLRRDLHFIIGKLKAGETKTFACTIYSDTKLDLPEMFQWDEKNADFDELVWHARKKRTPVLRYMHAAYDDSSKDVRNKTYKVFHHLYDPQGKHFVTNGGHTDPYKNEKSLLYPHHRGLMYGFNRITYDGKKKADTWHCTGDDYVEHSKTLGMEAGPVLGRHRVLLNWHGARDEVFATEERELTVYRINDRTLVEFASLLRTAGGPVRLDGDPQHAGFQFRAANQVAEKSAKQTYYLRTSGKGKPGETINWSPKKAPAGTVDVPWKAMSFVLGDQRYTAAYLDHPNNPGEARHSERDYGRFGCYFEYDLTKEAPLLVNYRLWLQQGEVTAPQVQACSDDFSSPPTVEVKK